MELNDVISLWKPTLPSIFQSESVVYYWLYLTLIITDLNCLYFFSPTKTMFYVYENCKSSLQPQCLDNALQLQLHKKCLLNKYSHEKMVQPLPFSSSFFLLPLSSSSLSLMYVNFLLLSQNHKTVCYSI